MVGLDDHFLLFTGVAEEDASSISRGKHTCQPLPSALAARRPTSVLQRVACALA